MKKSMGLMTIIAFLLLSISGLASPLEDKVKALESALKATPAEANPADSTSALTGRARVTSDSALADALKQIANADAGPSPGNSAEMTVAQILATHPSEAVQKAGTELLDEIAAERKARNEAHASELDGVLKKLTDVVSKSTRPSDLDDILVDLQKFQNQGYATYGEDQMPLSQKASQAYQFATGWQDYLSSVAHGNGDQARNELRNLAQNGYGITIVPRSHILELMSAPIPPPANSTSGENQQAPAPVNETADDILNKIKTLDQMEDAWRQLHTMNFPYNSAEAQSVQTLQNYVDCYKAIKAGLPSNLDLRNGVQSLPGHEDITLKIWLLALQALFPSFKGAPIENEKPVDFINRVITDATSRNDWDTLKLALVTKDEVTKSTQFGLYTPEATSGIDSLIAALNQETAGQYSQAVGSYEAALRSPSSDIPAKMIGEKLAALKRDHPDEYNAGYQQMLAPPRPYGFPPNFQYQPGMPGYGYPQNRFPTSMNITIPGRGSPASAPQAAVTNQTPAPIAPATNSGAPARPSTL